MFAKIPVLETERLLLRRMRERDADDMYVYAQDCEVTRYLTWNAHETQEQTRQYLQFLQTKYEDGTFHDWALIFKETNTMIGTCGFTKINCENDSAEIGFVLNRSYWGRGLAVEAALRVMRYGFEKLELHRIEARCMTDNHQSARVMEKCGMRYEGTFRDAMKIKGSYETIRVYGILADEFAVRRNSDG